MTNTVDLEVGRPSRDEILAAVAVSAVTVFVAGVAFRNARLQLAEVKPFLPIFVTMVVLCEGLTGYLLMQRARLAGTPFYGILSGAYIFAAFVAAAQLPTFPGVFSSDGLLGAGTQSAVWLWTFWHSGYPLLILLAAVGQQLHSRRAQKPFANLLRMLPWVGGVAAAIVVPLCIWGTGALPTLIQGGTYANLVHTLGMPVIGANVVALAGYLALTKLRRSVDIWVTVALVVSLADSTLTLHGGARYTLGWYAARLLSVVSSTILLSMLIANITRLYHAIIAANRQLEKQALIDSLTQVANRQAFDSRWEVERRRAEREEASLSILMIDIDHFKQVNDAYGHGRGDACLMAVASILSQVVSKRPADFVARYGGEEFVALLPNTELTGARDVAERIRLAVEQAALPSPSAGGVVTVSIGLSTYTPTQHSSVGSSRRRTGAPLAADVLAQADKALYDAKRSGRNAVAAR
jgi:diguanylate cyclase (GGDEF)-like protein